MTGYYSPRDDTGRVSPRDVLDAADQADYYASLRARTGTYRIPWMPTAELDPFEVEERAMGGWE